MREPLDPQLRDNIIVAAFMVDLEGASSYRTRRAKGALSYLRGLSEGDYEQVRTATWRGKCQDL